MGRLRLRSDTRRQRTVQMAPEVDRWVEELALTWAVSCSEAINQLLSEHRELRSALGAVEHAPGGSHVAPVLMERLKQELCSGMDRLREEVEKVKSNLYLLQEMQDLATARLLSEHQYTEWRMKVKEKMDKRKGGKA